MTTKSDFVIFSTLFLVAGSRILQTLLGFLLIIIASRYTKPQKAHGKKCICKQTVKSIALTTIHIVCSNMLDQGRCQSNSFHLQNCLFIYLFLLSCSLWSTLSFDLSLFCGFDYQEKRKHNY